MGVRISEALFRRTWVSRAGERREGAGAVVVPKCLMMLGYPGCIRKRNDACGNDCWCTSQGGEGTLKGLEHPW